MDGDVLWRPIKQPGHLFLRQPNGLVRQLNVQSHSCVLASVNDNRFVLRVGDGYIVVVAGFQAVETTK